jgi:hypothetical protein
METVELQQNVMVPDEPQKEHHWLHKFLGQWAYEVEAVTPSSQTTETSTGIERVRSLGKLWIAAEGEWEQCEGTTLLTLGYDPRNQRYVGTWIGSMSNYLWVYDGELDATERVLTLNAEGPSMSGDGKMVQYKDVIEFKSDDHRVMTSYGLDDNGQWQLFMTAHYRRTVAD